MSYFTTNFLKVGFGAHKIEEQASVLSSEKTLIRIGELAKLAGVLSSTINYYTREGLLDFEDETRGGYRLYHRDKALKKLGRIKEMQTKERLRINEIKQKLN